MIFILWEPIRSNAAPGYVEGSVTNDQLITQIGLLYTLGYLLIPDNASLIR